MKHLLITIISFFSLFQSCAESHSIQGTKWEYKINEESISFIEFKADGSYIEYDAEVGEHLYGRYEKREDRVLLSQERGEYDNEFQEGSKHKTPQKKFEMIIKNGSQMGYFDKLKGDNWENDYYFIKVNEYYIRVVNHFWKLTN